MGNNLSLHWSLLECHRDLYYDQSHSLFIRTDLSEKVKDCYLIQYADDTRYIQTGDIDDLPKLIQNTEQTLTKIKNYFDRNGLLLNSKKTQYILIGTRALISRIPDNVTNNTGDTSFQPGQNAKNVGVYSGRYTSFHVLVTQMSKKKKKKKKIWHIYVHKPYSRLTQQGNQTLIAVQAHALSHLN